MKRILIVDDEPFIRTLLEETLEEFEDQDVEVLVATNGAQGWQLIGCMSIPRAPNSSR